MDAPAGLEEALATDVLVREGGRLRFSHPLIGAVVQERTPPGEWRAIHARLAELADHPEQRARHLAAAADGTDEDVAAALEAAAGEAATRGATMAAAELAQRAAEMTPDADRRLRRLIAAADAAMVVGDGQSARGSLDEVVARAEPGPLRAGALHRLAQLVTDDSALRVAESALEEAGDDDALRAEVHLTACRFATMGGEIPRALRHAETGARHAEAAGASVALADALCSIAYIRHIAGEGVQRELLVRADALERAGADRFDETALELLGMQLYTHAKLAESRRLLRASSSAPRRAAESIMRAWRSCSSPSSRSARAAGSSRTATPRRRSTSRSGPRAGTPRRQVTGPARSSTRTWVAWTRRASTRRPVAARRRRSATSPSRRAAHTSWVSSRCRSATRTPRCGTSVRSASASSGWESASRRRSASPRISRRRWSSPATSTRRGTVQAELEARGRELGRTWAVATGLRCRGLIAAVEGRPDDALTALHEAIAVHAEVPQPFDRARTLMVLGTTQRRCKAAGGGARVAGGGAGGVRGARGGAVGGAGAGGDRAAGRPARA